MTQDERNKVRQTANENGMRNSTVNNNVMVDNNGNRLKEVGTNRTIYKGTTYYGSKSITDALNG